MTKLGDILHSITGVKLRGPRRCTIGSIVLDSRAVQPGTLFAALRGNTSDGRLFIPEAIHRGASAILSEPPRPESCPPGVVWIESEQPRKALAEIVRRFHGAPDERLDIVGITGTDGKTSTSHMLSSALFANGIPTGLGGTLGQKFGTIQTETTLTTPEAPALYSFLTNASAEGAEAVVLEVSSAALIAERVHAMSFAGAILTGVGHDHLDLHETLEDYVLAKHRLFDMLPASAFAVLPGDDAHFRSFRDVTRAKVITFGQNERCEWKISGHKPSTDSATFLLEGPGFQDEVQINRPAVWDARNLAASVAAAVAMGASADYAVRGAACCPPIPGRWESIEEGQSFSAIVDYAHTPDALGRALRHMRQVIDGKVIVVFGCGGNRDQDKRAPMGKIAGEFADAVFVTDDNPRYEDPGEIASQIMSGLATSSITVKRIADRGEAIRCAVARARTGDGVLIAGKGHETTQELDGRQHSFDDREQLAAAIRSAGVRP